jgi:hypothetical protein
MERVAVLCAITFAALAATSAAGVRHFAYLYETPTSPAGGFELENWVTWLSTTDHGRVDAFAFRHELEFGITDQLQASIYFADWSYSRIRNHSISDFSDVALELIYNVTNPVLDPVGISLYQEYRGGHDFFEWESKVIAQKNLGPLIFAYNGTIEAVWQGEGLNEQEGEFIQSLGASYQLSARLSVGLEFLHEFLFPEWRDAKTIRNVFVGPNVSYRRHDWFVTVTGLAQATDTSDEADFQVRTIFGIGF